jgi:hypothetical protein
MAIYIPIQSEIERSAADGQTTVRGIYTNLPQNSNLASRL